MENMDSSGSSEGNSQICKPWPYMTPLEKLLFVVCVAFSIVIFSLTLVLIARDYRLGPLEPITKDCSFSSTDWDKYAPLVLSTDDLSFIYPNATDKTIRLTNGDSVLLACPGTTFRGISSKESQLEVSCFEGQHRTLQQNVNLKDLRCTKNFNSTARFTGHECFRETREIEIGFAINSTAFVRQIKVCFNDFTKEAMYTEFLLSGSIRARFPNSPTPRFNPGTFYKGFDPDELFHKQAPTINNILAVGNDSTKYINYMNGTFLDRGHLASRADFIYPYQQNATYYYVNAAPQWHLFNDGNWQKIEHGVRKLAAERNTDLVIYTGTYAVLKLLNATSQPVEIFIIPQTTSLLTILEFPVPKYFWKVVYSPRHKLGVALVGVNDPYINSTGVHENLICENITSKISWLTWSPNDVNQGLSYACEIDDLRKSISYIPSLDLLGLLT